MNNLVQFKIPGRVQPWQRPRPRGHGYGYITPKATINYEKIVASESKIAMGSRPPFKGSISLTVHLIEGVPPSYSKLKRQRCLAGDIFPSGCDIDNQTKSLLDGMSGVIYDDDRQVVHLEALRSYGEKIECSVLAREIQNIGDI